MEHFTRSSEAMHPTTLTAEYNIRVSTRCFVQGEIPLQGDFTAEHMIFGGKRKREQQHNSAICTVRCSLPWQHVAVACIWPLLQVFPPSLTRAINSIL